MVKHLLADQRLSALIQNRLFPLALPQEDEDLYPDGVTPAVVYQRISSPRTLGLTGECASNPRVQFSAYGGSFGQVKQIAQVLNDSLDYFAGELGGRARTAVLRADNRDSYEHETGLYRSDVDFFILHIKS